MPDTKPWFEQYHDDQAATGFVQNSQGTGIAGPGYGITITPPAKPLGRPPQRATLPATPNVLGLGVDLARSFVVWCWRRALR